MTRRFSARLATAVLAVCAVLPLFGSESIWRDLRLDAAPQNGTRTFAPSRFRLVELDTVAFQNIAADAPPEHTPSRVTISLPMPDGSFSDFALFDSPILDEKLAAKLPDVKTFVAQGIDDPSATARLDWTPAGFHAVIFSSGGTIYIDPYLRGDTRLYMSYARGDYTSKKDFNCGVTGRGSSMDRATGEIAIGPTLHTYRLAVAATAEYTAFHGSIPASQAAIVTTINRVNGIYEKEVGIRFTLVDNTAIIYSNPASDPFGNTWEDIEVIQTVIDSMIGNANYDVGHLVGTGGGGIAGWGVACITGYKAQGLTGSDSPIGDPFDVDYVAHEIGHQFQGSHTFNGTTGSCGGGNRDSYAAYEPGSGSTIMAYAGICGSENLQPNSDPYFHAVSFDEIAAYVQSVGCGVATGTGNSAPVVSAGSPITIPRSTPFHLTGSATDANGDTLTYSWEQLDLGTFAPPNTDNGNRPIFRSFNPTVSPTRTFPRLADLVNNTTTLGESLPVTTRTMTFRLTARDNRAGGGGVAYASRTVSVTSTAGPFVVQTPNSAVSWSGGSEQIVAWDVANTTAAPVSCANVKIQLSTDGGVTFPTTILASTPNDGSQSITLPNVSTGSARIRVECTTSPFFDISNVNFSITTPLIVIATATSTTSVDVTWSGNAASSWEVWRRAAGGSFTHIATTSLTSYTDTTAAPDSAYLYAVRPSLTPNLDRFDLATTVMFTDPALSGAIVKAAHVTELRAAAAAVRALAGAGSFSFTDPTITAGVTEAKGAHVLDLRSAIAAARTALALSSITFTDPTLDTIKAVHLEELRDAVK